MLIGKFCAFFLTNAADSKSRCAGARVDPSPAGALGHGVAGAVLGATGARVVGEPDKNMLILQQFPIYYYIHAYV